MQIIAGLGNPGAKYASNRHNIGFMAADEIVRRHSFSPWKNKFSAEISEGTISGVKVLVMKPVTMMNLSGDAIGQAMRFYKLSPGDVSVIYDELDLAPGKVRIKVGGGNGGHNGIKSTESHIGKDFTRIRLGIGHPGRKEQVISHVLGDFAKADQDWLQPLLRAFADEFPLLVSGDQSTFMNKVALSVRSDEPKPGNTPRQPASKPARGSSHIHQARNGSKKPDLPRQGPMADMLKKLLKK